MACMTMDFDMDFSNEIQKVIRYFEDEMSKIEAANLFVTPYRTNPATTTGDYIKQKQTYCEERTNALRRALYRVLGTEEQQEQMFMSPDKTRVSRDNCAYNF